MLDYYDWKELRAITKLLKSRLKLPGDIGFEWPRPLREPPPPREREREREMEIKIVEPGPLPERRLIPLTQDEVEMLVDASNTYFVKYMKRIQRTHQPRTKKESIALGERQALFQRLARVRNQWETHAVWEEPERTYTKEDVL